MNKTKLIKSYILKKLKSYKLTKANLPIRAELADIAVFVDEVAASSTNSWIDVEKHLPSESVVLTYHTDGSIRVTDLSGDEYEHAITHWQPLPQAPTNSEQSQ